MSNLPEKLYICDDYTGFFGNIEPIDSEDVEYIRADLVPTWRTMSSAPAGSVRILGKDANGVVNLISQAFGDRYLTGNGERFYPVKWMPIPR